MNKICTSIEQSKKLIKLVIDVDTADMSYCPIMNIDSGKNDGYLETPDCYPFSEVRDFLIPYLPAWSLSALLIILPQGTRLIKSATDEMYHCDCPKGNIDKWFDNPLDAAFEMICWLKENGKI